MKKEKYTERSDSVSIKISGSQIASVKESEILRTGFRIYKDKKIGVAGSLGKFNKKKLEKKAIDALDAGITYPFGIESNVKEKKVTGKLSLDGKWLLSETEIILEKLRKEHPDVIFSHKVEMSRSKICLKNDQGLDLSHEITAMQMGLVYKMASSANIMDGFIGYHGIKYDRDAFLKDSNEILTAHKNEVEIPNGIYPVIVETGYASLFLSKIISDLSGISIGTGSSILKDKMGKKAFSKDFTLLQSTEEDYLNFPFFDHEGCFSKDLRVPLIENGVLLSPYSDKRVSDKFKLPHTFSAGGTYDSVPTLSLPGYRIAESCKTLKELLGGRPGIFVKMASGGDTTATGDFATPIQVAFWFDGDKFVGKLPQIQIRSDIYKMFGKDFIGVAKNSISDYSVDKPLVVDMQVENL